MTNEIKSLMTVLKKSCRSYSTDALKTLATTASNQIATLEKIMVEFPDNRDNYLKVSDLRSVRAAAIDVMIERDGEAAGDKFMDALGL